MAVVLFQSPISWQHSALARYHSCLGDELKNWKTQWTQKQLLKSYKKMHWIHLLVMMSFVAPKEISLQCEVVYNLGTNVFIFARRLCGPPPLLPFPSPLVQALRSRKLAFKNRTAPHLTQKCWLVPNATGSAHARFEPLPHPWYMELEDLLWCQSKYGKRDSNCW